MAFGSALGRRRRRTWWCDDQQGQSQSARATMNESNASQLNNKKAKQRDAPPPPPPPASPPQSPDRAWREPAWPKRSGTNTSRSSTHTIAARAPDCRRTGLSGHVAVGVHPRPLRHLIFYFIFFLPDSSWLSFSPTLSFSFLWVAKLKQSSSHKTVSACILPPISNDKLNRSILSRPYGRWR